MRPLPAFATATLALLALVAPTAAQQVAGSAQSPVCAKVAYLDSRKVIQATPGAADAQAQVQTEMQRYQDKLKVLNDSLSKVVEDFQRQSQLLSADARQARQASLVKLRDSLQQQAQTLQEEAQQKQTDLMQPVMDRIDKVVQQIRQEGGYAIVFDVASAAMVSADSTLDLTDKVIARLKAASPPPPKKRP